MKNCPCKLQFCRFPGAYTLCSKILEFCLANTYESSFEILQDQFAATSGTVFERELGHLKLDVHFACFRHASSVIPKEIATRSARTLWNPFHGRG